MAIAERGEFKGNPMIILKDKPDSQYPFQFGLNKAKLVIACIDAIKRFVEEETGKKADDDDIK